MARSLANIKLVCRLLADIKNTIDGSDISAPAMGRDFKPTLSSGTTADKADRFWYDSGRTITSASSEDIDVYDLGSIDLGAGAGKDALGQTWTVAEIVALIVVNETASAGSLLVGGKSATTAWNSPFGGSDDDAFIELKPGGSLILFAPSDPAYAVADTTNHLLKMAASGGNVTYAIGLLGRSA